MNSVSSALEVNDCGPIILVPSNFVSNPIFIGRMKHVEVDYNFVRDRIQKKLLDVRFISNDD
jgi:hypothetical protein